MGRTAGAALDPLTYMSGLVGAAIVFAEGDPPSDVYPTRGTIVGTLAYEHGDVWHVVHFDDRNGYTLHPEEHVLVRPRWKGEAMVAGRSIELLTKPLPVGTPPAELTAMSGYPFGPWVTAVIEPTTAEPGR